jgi:RimJ/RimL family protein N-acetyltransferase
MRFLKLDDAKRAAKLTELLHTAYESDEKLQIHFGAAKVTIDQVAQHILTTPTFVLENDDQTIIATTSVRLPWSSNPGPFKIPHLGWVATNPDYQHRGYAKTIISTVIDQFIQQTLKAPAVSLGTAAEHPWLQEAYQSLGFIHVDTVRKFPDHQTAYLVNIFNQEQTFGINDAYLQSVIQKKYSKTILR